MIIPIVFSNQDGSTDLRFGNGNYSNANQLPVPLPKELASEFEFTNVRHMEFYQTDDFRVKRSDNTTLVRVQNTGDVTILRDTVIGRHLNVFGNATIDGNTQINGLLHVEEAVEFNDTLDVAQNVYIGNNLDVHSNLSVFANVFGYGNATFSGTVSGSVKTFNIPHPSKPDHRLRHACLEGPEHAVFFRGSTYDRKVDLPEYWRDLVDPNSIHAFVTAGGWDPVGRGAVVMNNVLYIHRADDDYSPTNYLVVGTRKDVAPLIVEYLSSENDVEHL